MLARYYFKYIFLKVLNIFSLFHIDSVFVPFVTQNNEIWNSRQELLLDLSQYFSSYE